MKKNNIVFILLITFFSFGFISSKEKKYLLDIEMYYFQISLEQNIESEKIFKLTIRPYHDIIVPVINKKQLFYVTKCQDNNDRKNKKQNLIIHLDWNFDSTIVVDKIKFRHLKNSTDYVEIIDLSNYKDIESITFSFCYLVGKTPLGGISKRNYMPSRLNRYSVTIFLDKDKDYIPLLIKSI